MRRERSNTHADNQKGLPTGGALFLYAAVFFLTLRCVHPVAALFRRNAWATRSLLQWCSWQRPETVTATGRDVYGSIEELFNHILGAESRYQRLLTGLESPHSINERRTPLPLADLGDRAEGLADEWLALLREERDVEVLRAHERGGGRSEMPDWVPLLQAVHHGDDHRAQVGTLLGRQDVLCPELDVWMFAFANADPNESEAGFADALLRRGFEYHVWATGTLLEHCARLTDDQLTLTAPGTYGSILDTANHLVDSDWGYLRRLLRAETRSEPDPIDQVRERFRDQARRWLDYLASGPDYQAPVECSDGWYRAWVLVAQAFHHGNDHRTHIGTVLLHHELEAPEIDVWAYAQAEGLLRELA